LHGVRQAEVALAETVGVIGLGLVGQLATRIAAAAGAEVVGIDLTQTSVDLASSSGVRAMLRDQPGLEQTIKEMTRGLGLDAVLLCAATRSSDPLMLAARLARDRGRLVVLGDLPIEIDRALLYEKELELRVSRSYGAGRYDIEYEVHGRDLPAGYVRWTEQRNLLAFLDLLAAGRVEVESLTTHRFPVERAADAYAVLTSSERQPFGILLEYGSGSVVPKGLPPQIVRAHRREAVRVGFVGAGTFARSTLLPAFAQAGAELVAVSSGSGLSAADTAARLGFERAVHADALIEADDIDAIVVATRHGSHAELVVKALAAGKPVFVEKPLALSHEQLRRVEAAIDDRSMLMVGFNRRYAPLVQTLRVEVEGVGDLVLALRVNAGHLPPDHWLHDAVEGGGRLLGEACHFVDLAAHIVGSPVSAVHTAAVIRAECAIETSDNFVASLSFASGAVASLVYSGGGDQRLAKERIEAFGGGTAVVLDDFRRLEIFRHGKRKQTRARQDKGHHACVGAFVAAVRGITPPPAIGTYLNATAATLAMADSLRSGHVVTLV
jgi:predicted dehydrogenase